MTARPSEAGVRAILLDIEGTTTPIAFVHETLFPFARRHLADFLQAERDTPALHELAQRLAAERAAEARRGEQPPPWRTDSPDAQLASLAAYVGWLMDRDRKSPGLKELQGLIWERGYQAGTLRGEVFADVAPAMRRWRAAGLDIAIYSSGSELAQRRLFESTASGDLTPLIAAFFDTRVGPKTSEDSYAHIAAALRLAPAEVLFVSDVAAELQAARAAGFQVVLSVRPGNAPQPAVEGARTVHSFDEIESIETEN